MTSLPPVLHSIPETPPPFLCPGPSPCDLQAQITPKRNLHSGEKTNDITWSYHHRLTWEMVGQSSPIQHLGRCGLFSYLVYENLCDLNLAASSRCLGASRGCRRIVKISLSSSETISDHHSVQHPQKYPLPLAAAGLTDPSFEQQIVEADSCPIPGFVEA